jgi:hypothetical protein
VAQKQPKKIVGRKATFSVEEYTNTELYADYKNEFGSLKSDMATIKAELSKLNSLRQ